MSSRLPTSAYEVLTHLPLPMADVWNEITKSSDGLFYPRLMKEDHECKLSHGGLVIYSALSATPDAGTFDLHTRIEQKSEQGTTPLAMLGMSLDASTNSATLQRCSLGKAGPSTDFATAQQSAAMILEAIRLVSISHETEASGPNRALSVRCAFGKQSDWELKIDPIFLGHFMFKKAAPAVNYVRNSLALAPVTCE